MKSNKHLAYEIIILDWTLTSRKVMIKITQQMFKIECIDYFALLLRLDKWDRLCYLLEERTKKIQGLVSEWMVLCWGSTSAMLLFLNSWHLKRTEQMLRFLVKCSSRIVTLFWGFATSAVTRYNRSVETQLTSTWCFCIKSTSISRFRLTSSLLSSLRQTRGARLQVPWHMAAVSNRIKSDVHRCSNNCRYQDIYHWVWWLWDGTWFVFCLGTGIKLYHQKQLAICVFFVGTHLFKLGLIDDSSF